MGMRAFSRVVPARPARRAAEPQSRAARPRTKGGSTPIMRAARPRHGRLDLESRAARLGWRGRRGVALAALGTLWTEGAPGGQRDAPGAAEGRESGEDPQRHRQPLVPDVHRLAPGAEQPASCTRPCTAPSTEWDRSARGRGGREAARGAGRRHRQGDRRADREPRQPRRRAGIRGEPRRHRDAAATIPLNITGLALLQCRMVAAHRAPARLRPRRSPRAQRGPAVRCWARRPSRGW